MCGIVGVVLQDDSASPLLLESLTTLQHRGQDAAGISTVDETGRTRLVKGNGQCAEVFKEESELVRLQGRYGVGHVRYPTAGTPSHEEAQPFYTNSPYGLSLAHNGNLTNTKELREVCRKQLKRQVNTESDSELILAVFAHEMEKETGRTGESSDGPECGAKEANDKVERVFAAIERVMSMCEGAFAVIICITGVGIVGFRDPHGIRPLCFGERTGEERGGMIASESVAVEIGGFSLIRDVNPGEAVLIPLDLSKPIITKQCAKESILSPCIFEYVYFARPDSIIDGALVFQARANMGAKLAERIRKVHPDSPIDVVVPVPSTSRVSAIQCAIALGVPYVEGLVRNRYTQRTFIMPGQKKRNKSVRLKLNPVAQVIKGKAVLLVDDSIVRGTTSKHIVDIVRAAGATKVYFASAAPAIRFPNVYGIDMPTPKELIAFGRDEKQIAEHLAADWVIYQSIPDLVSAVRECNPKLRTFDMSCFNGEYCAGPLPVDYFDALDMERNDNAKEKVAKPSNGGGTPVRVSSPSDNGTLGSVARRVPMTASVSSSPFGF